ncbi:CBS domain-containing protein [Halanaerocella petrolearia]
MRLREVMTDDVSVVGPDTTVNEAAQVMKNLNVGSVPVCENGKAVGILTDRDITIRNVANDGDANAQVKEIMSDEVVCGTPEMDAQRAADVMASNQVRRLPIVENEELVGMVALGDLAVNNRLEMEAGSALTYISTPSKPE